MKEHARHPFLYPMVVFAAHTGARRAEIVRSHLRDIDFGAGMVTIHERKKSHESTTIRRVPMSPLLAGVLKEWIAQHPGGTQTFCHGLQVARSKTKRCQPLGLTADETHDHFKRTLAESKWVKLRGWHVLRHSFASNCAAK
jgi:integrase